MNTPSKKFIIVIGAAILAVVAIGSTIRYFVSQPVGLKTAAFPRKLLAVYRPAVNTVNATFTPLSALTLKLADTTDVPLSSRPFDSLIKQTRDIFLNLEVWQGTPTVAEAVIRGAYDKKLTRLFRLLAGKKQEVYVLYNGEMELPTNKYPWQYQSCSQYIRSFRHVASIARRHAPRVRLVWGPSGYPGAEEYWPGTEYVDDISVNIASGPEIAHDPYPAYSSTKALVRRKLFRMRFMDKPVLLFTEESADGPITESGLLDSLNTELAEGKQFFRTPTEPSDTDTGRPFRSAPLIMGVYDPLSQLVTLPAVSVEHIFTDMISVKNGRFRKDFDAVIARHHDVIVTIEPWKDGKTEKDPQLLANTIAGVYDDTWASLYEVINYAPQRVYLRWGHEMEIPVDRYPWQKQDPVAYIKAFRYIAFFRGIKAKNVSIVWGPAGDRGSVEWWPGDDAVDFVSIAIYGLPDKNINDYNRQESFASILRKKLQRVRFARKPVFITEFGVKGPEDYQQKWLAGAAVAISNNPEIKGICYFNFADTPNAWGNADTPDWAITPASYQGFVTSLKQPGQTKKIPN